MENDSDILNSKRMQILKISRAIERPTEPNQIYTKIENGAGLLASSSSSSPKSSTSIGIIVSNKSKNNYKKEKNKKKGSLRSETAPLMEMPLVKVGTREIFFFSFQIIIYLAVMVSICLFHFTLDFIIIYNSIISIQ